MTTDGRRARTRAVCGTVLVAQSRLPKTDTVLHPGDPEQFRGVMIVSVYGTGKKNTDAAASHGFVQLYNSTDRDIGLPVGAVILPQGQRWLHRAVLPGGCRDSCRGLLLVRAASPKGYNTAGALINVLYADRIECLYRQQGGTPCSRLLPAGIFTRQRILPR